ncbi:hypothetical protein V8E36_002786 [Tilletia maclaganii]
MLRREEQEEAERRQEQLKAEEMEQRREDREERREERRMKPELRMSKMMQEATTSYNSLPAPGPARRKLLRGQPMARISPASSIPCPWSSLRAAIHSGFARAPARSITVRYTWPIPFNWRGTLARWPVAYHSLCTDHGADVVFSGAGLNTRPTSARSAPRSLLREYVAATAHTVAPTVAANTSVAPLNTPAAEHSAAGPSPAACQRPVSSPHEPQQ